MSEKKLPQQQASRQEKRKPRQGCPLEQFLSQLFVSDNAAEKGNRAVNHDCLVKSRVVNRTDMLEATSCWEL